MTGRKSDRVGRLVDVGSGVLSVRWGLCVAAALAACLTSSMAWAADERVAMPFACSVQDGRVVMTPAAEQSYRIIGRHEQQQYTACPRGSPDRCTTWILHRFDIMCGSTRVAWMHAVAAAMQRIDGRLSVEQGRLNIPFRDAPVVAVAACSTAPGPLAPGGGASGAQRAVERACGPPLSADASVPLPAGFAPVMRLGARFVAGSETVAASTTPGLAAAVAPTDVAVKSTDAARPRDPYEQGKASVVGAMEAQSARSEVILTGWVTQTRAEPRGDGIAARLRMAAGEPIANAGLAYGTFTTMGLLMLAAVAATAWLRQQPAGGVPFAGVWRWTGAVFSSFRSTDDPMTAAEAAKRCAELIRAADRLHQIVRSAVGDLAAQPLKKVLERELAGIEAALMSPELTRHSAARKWDKVEARMRGVRSDLERIHRIATSASTLPPGMRTPDAMPANEAEAREVLGVSAVAQERIVKKVVDALRQSWHPDHASDADDRRAREQRLKQINVAWDLINRRQDRAA